MKHIRKISLAIGVIAMLSLCGCSGNFKYEKYSSKDTQINISMDYISGWLYSETRGAAGSYAQVLFYEPQRKDKKFKAGIAVNVQEISKIKPDAPDIESFADALLERRQKLKDMKLLSRSNSEICGEQAITIELSYKTLDQLNSVDAKLIPVKEKIVILQKNNKFYTIRYQNTDKEFESLSKAFSYILKTIEFKNNK